MKGLFKYGGMASVLLAMFMLTGCLKSNSLYTDFSNPTPLADIALSNLSVVGDSLTGYALDMPAGSEWVDTAIAVHLSDANHVGNVTFTMALADTNTVFQGMLHYNQQMFALSDSATFADYVNSVQATENYDSTDLANFTDSMQSVVQGYIDNLNNYGYVDGTSIPLGQYPLTLMPDSLYAFPNGMSVTIPNAGVLSVGDFKVNFKMGATDADGNYLFATHNYVLPIEIADAGSYEIASNFRMIFLVVVPNPND